MLSAFDLWILILETRTLWVLIVGNVRLTEVNFTCACGSLWFSDSAVCGGSAVRRSVTWYCHRAVTTGSRPTPRTPATLPYGLNWHKYVSGSGCTRSLRLWEKRKQLDRGGLCVEGVGRAGCPALGDASFWLQYAWRDNGMSFCQLSSWLGTVYLLIDFLCKWSIFLTPQSPSHYLCNTILMWRHAAGASAGEASWASEAVQPDMSRCPELQTSDFTQFTL